MVLILTDATQKPVGETVPGELFRIELRSKSATCLTLEKPENGRLLIGILQFQEIDRPSFLVNLAANIPALSFGTAWAIEPVIGQETYPRLGYFHEDAGVLFLQDGDAILRFDNPQRPDDYDVVNASLIGNGRIERANHAVPCMRWRIWQTAADRDRAGGEPLVQFG